MGTGVVGHQEYLVMLDKYFPVLYAMPFIMRRFRSVNTTCSLANFRIPSHLFPLLLPRPFLS